MEDSDLILNLTSGPTAKEQSKVWESPGPSESRPKSRNSHQLLHPRSNEKAIFKRQNADIVSSKLSSLDSDVERATKSSDKGTSKTATVGKPKDVISSLFTKNPEIPDVKLQNIGAAAVDLFSHNASKDVSCGLEENFMKNLENNFNVKRFTQIQSMSIPNILNNYDCLIKSPTGSGKTLAYAVPVVHKLQKIRPKIQRSDGPYVIIILPTRELALQSYQVFETLCRTYVWLVPGIICGGEKKKAEKSRLRKGVNILVSTPGRLLDHMNTTKCLDLSHVLMLIFDEADRLLDMGFEKDINSILEYLAAGSSGNKQQTVLLSATLTKKVEDLAKLSLQEPKLLDPSTKTASIKSSDDVERSFLAPKTLTQKFVFVPAKIRLVALMALFMKRLHKRSSKIMVFVSSKVSVTFHSQLIRAWIREQGFCWNIFQLHGDMPQQDRISNLSSFKDKSGSILFCTNVAARGLDLPFVNCIIQYTCAGDVKEYIHRVGRTARMGSQGEAILFLLPSESGYVNRLQDESLCLQEVKLFNILKAIDPRCSDQEEVIQEAATKIQLKLEDITQADSKMMKLAAEAYQSFIQAYSTYPSKLKEIFKVKSLHLGHIAKSFSLREVPQKIATQYIVKPPKTLPVVPKKRKLQETHKEHSGGLMSGPMVGKKKHKKK